MIRRNTTRTAKNATETTTQTDTPSATTLAFNLLTSDKFYLAFRKPFSCRYFHLSTPSPTAGAVTVKYWNGTAFAAVEDVVDQTLGFTASGFISWANLTDWRTRAAAPFADQDLYWIEITVGTGLDATTVLQAVLNLFCDDASLRSLYPELLSDSRWLPPDRTNFLEQYVAAKDLVVQRLKQSQIIVDESEVLDVDQLVVPTVHATAHIIMFPLSSADEGNRQLARDAQDAMDKALSKVRFTFDSDNSGINEAKEEANGNVYRVRA